jgi:hypothetical protein
LLRAADNPPPSNPPSDTKGKVIFLQPTTGAPSTPEAQTPPADSPEAQAPQSSGPTISGLSNLLSLPAIQQFIRPDGFALPNGAGAVHQGPNSIKVDLNTPNGPFSITLPKPQGANGQSPVEDPPVPRDGYPAGPIEPLPSNERPAAPSGPFGISRDSSKSREFVNASRPFRMRNYGTAVWRAARFLERRPSDSDLLQLHSLACFALGDYETAYRDAIAVPPDSIWDWPTLRSMYRSGEDYTAQFRMLEARAQTGQSPLELRFLLGYHYLMQGHRDAARRQIGTVLSADRQNLAARNLMVLAQSPPKGSSQPPAKGSAASSSGGSAPSVSLGSSSPEIDLGKGEAIGGPSNPPAANP